MRTELKIMKKLVTALMILSLLLCGCNNNNENKQPQQQQVGTEEQGDKIPDQLKSMENNIEKIIKALDGPAVEVKEEKGAQGQGEEDQGMDKQKEGQQKEGQQKEAGGQEEQGKEGGSKEGGNKEQEKEGGQNKEGQNKEGGQEKQQQAGGQAQKPQDPWQKIDPIINKLHYQWNSFSPQAVTKNANRELVDKYSTALNSLTNTVIGKNKTNTLLAASYLYAYIPDFYALYKTQTSPEIKRIRYYTRNAMLNAMTANWVQADQDIENLKATWNMYKNTVPKDQQKSANQLDYSIYEFEKVVKEKNQPLCDIKGRVAMSNIQALEKAMEEGAEGGGKKGADEGGKEGGKEGTEQGSKEGSGQE